MSRYTSGDQVYTGGRGRIPFGQGRFDNIPLWPVVAKGVAGVAINLHKRHMLEAGHL